jgi:hypothetical protein
VCVFVYSLVEINKTAEVSAAIHVVLGGIIENQNSDFVMQ